MPVPNQLFAPKKEFACACIIFLATALISIPAASQSRETASTGAKPPAGGFFVQVGGSLDVAEGALQTQRFLVQVLHPDREHVKQWREKLVSENKYGMVSVSWLADSNRLPYTENLVNVLWIDSEGGERVPVSEITRVLCPGGWLAAAKETVPRSALEEAGFVDFHEINIPLEQGTRTVIAAAKPWPSTMDHWTHPRHGPDGNPVSNDMLVGPPQRVRWVVGAQSEVPGLISAGGRNYYAGILARDAFNGLRLWNKDLVKPEADEEGLPFVLRRLPSNIPAPVANDDLVFAVSKGRLTAFEGRTGRLVRTYPDTDRVRAVLLDRDRLFATDAASVRCFDAGAGALLWQTEVSQPREMVIGNDAVFLVAGDARRGDTSRVLALNRADGSRRWERADLPWAARVYRLVYYEGMVACEVSTLNNDGPGNALHMLAAGDGQLVWEREFFPGMNHVRQARAMFVDDLLWLLEGGRGADDQRFPLRATAVDPLTGKNLKSHPSGLAHCFPPVATPRFMIAGEMNFTDLQTGKLLANHITKAACGRDNGWVPANGLLYVTPKHCVCWPMLRGYAALAPDRPEGNLGEVSVDEMEFPVERGPAWSTALLPDSSRDGWPCYRHDEWRSAGTTDPGPEELEVLWRTELGAADADGLIVQDWKENPYIKGPVTSPVVSGNRVIVARPDAHEVVCLDSGDGRLVWRLTVEGRVDTAPTLHRGLCLFGTKLGWVYCVRADDGQLVWRLRAAPVDERIMAYGQVESPWPVPGSVLVMDDTAYFAAGRQSLADGGILVFAVDPATGQRRWIQRLDTVPQQGFYESSGLEFDNFDLLYREGSRVAMSRWSFEQKDGAIAVDRWNVYARQDTGGGASLVPRGSWSYAPRHQARIKSFTPLRSLVAFRDRTLFGCLQGKRTLFRRDFQLEEGEKVETRWMTGWAAGQQERDGKHPWPTDRLAEKASWKVDLFDQSDASKAVHALVLAGQRLFVASRDGELRVVAADDGRDVARTQLPAPLWDGMAIVGDRLYYTTAEGDVLCLGN